MPNVVGRAIGEPEPLLQMVCQGSNRRVVEQQRGRQLQPRLRSELIAHLHREHGVDSEFADGRLRIDDLRCGETYDGSQRAIDRLDQTRSPSGRRESMETVREFWPLLAGNQ